MSKLRLRKGKIFLKTSTINLALWFSFFSIAEKLLLKLSDERALDSHPRGNQIKIPNNYLNNPGNYPTINSKVIGALVNEDIKLENFLYNLKIRGLVTDMSALEKNKDLSALRELYLSGLLLDPVVSFSVFKMILKDENSSPSHLLPIRTPAWQLFTEIKHWRYVFETYNKIDQQYFLEALFITNSVEITALIARHFPIKLAEGAILNIDSSTEEYIINSLVNSKFLGRAEITLLKKLTNDPKNERLCELRLIYSQASSQQKDCENNENHINFIKDALELNYLTSGTFGDEFATEFLRHYDQLNQSTLKYVLKNLPTFSIGMLSVQLESEGDIKRLEVLHDLVGYSATLALKEPDPWIVKLCEKGDESIIESLIPTDKFLLCYLNIDTLKRFNSNTLMRKRFESYLKDEFNKETLDYLLALYPSWEGNFNSLLEACQREIRLK